MLNDIQPTLTDQEVIDFCVNGYIMLEGVIPDETNRRTFDYLDEHPSVEPKSLRPERDWVIDTDFDPFTANYKGKNDGCYTFNSPIPVSIEPSWAVAEMYYWLCGKLDEFKLSGGQGWPLESNRGDRAFTRAMVQSSLRLQKEMKDYKPR